ncbi:large subunit ribosomal protein L54, partial [Phenoliferia sp. Uapishka_3]
MIGCTCRAISRAQRTFTILPIGAKSLSSSSSLFNSPAVAPKLIIPQSSCPAGTKIAGLNILKNGSDVVALEDHEYPSWLWTLVAPVKVGKKEAEVAKSDAEKLKDARRALQKAGTDSIKAANTLKSK